MKTSALFALLFGAALLPAANYPEPVQGDWTVRDFRFHTGEVLPELRLHYTTVGAPTGKPVLILHGTGGTGAGFLRPDFGGELFGPGQPLDAATHYLIMPDAVGAGKSSKPSDGMKTKFPQYNYDDMVQAQYRLLTEHLGVKHTALVTGVSMGGMLAWVWGEMYPDFMDKLLPTAAQPTEVAGRNWMMRRMIIDLIKTDPEWNGGNYTKQPRAYSWPRCISVPAPAGERGRCIKWRPRGKKPIRSSTSGWRKPRGADANDVLYSFLASRDYNPAPKLETIRAQVLAINSADDERNPPELGIMEREIKRVKNGRYVLIPTSDESRGHGTMGIAKLWKQYLAEFMQPPVQASK